MAIQDTRRENTILITGVASGVDIPGLGVHPSYPMDLRYGIINADTREFPVSIHLPKINQSGIYGVDDNRVIIYDYYGNASVNPITVYTESGDTINGAESIQITTNYSGCEIIPSSLTSYISAPFGNSSGGGTIVQIELADLINLINNNNLSPLTVYQITDGDTINNQNLQLVNVTSITINQLLPTGTALYWYPDYQLDSSDLITIKNVWVKESLRTALSLPAYQAGDVAIYNNLRYQNLTGTNTDTNPATDTTNWQFLTQSIANGYIRFWNEVVFDVNLNLIVKRRESIPFTNFSPSIANGYSLCDNVAVLDTATWILSGLSSINYLQWGVGTNMNAAGLLDNRNNRMISTDIFVDLGSAVLLNESVSARGTVCRGGSTIIMTGRIGNANNVYVLDDSELDIEGILSGGMNATGLEIKGASSLTATGNNSVFTRARLDAQTTITGDPIDITESNISGCTITVDNNSGSGKSLIKNATWGRKDIVCSIETFSANFGTLNNTIINGDVTLAVGADGKNLLGNPTAVGMTIDSDNTVSLLGAAVATQCRIGKAQPPIIVVAESGRTSGNIANCVLEGLNIDTLYWIFYDDQSNNCVDKLRSSFYNSLSLMTTAWSALTTYKAGDCATESNITYIYINPVASAGNLVSDNSYWVSIYVLASATFTLIKNISYLGEIGIDSVNASQTITKITTNNPGFLISLSSLINALTITRSAAASATTDQIVLTSGGDVVLSTSGSNNDNITLVRNGGNINNELARNIYT